MTKRKDCNYWGKMTWYWYAVPFVYKKNARKYSVNTDLKYCKECENVYSIDSNRTSKTYCTQHNYSMIPNINLKNKDCYICRNKNAKVVIS